MLSSAIAYRPSGYTTFYNEAVAFATASKDLRTKLPTLPDVPVIALVSQRNLDDPVTGRIWEELQRELVALTRRGELRRVAGGHYIQVDHPDAVLRAIDDVVSAPS